MIFNDMLREDDIKSYIAFIVTGGSKYSLGSLLQKYKNQFGLFGVDLSESYDRSVDCGYAHIDSIECNHISISQILHVGLRNEVAGFDYYNEPIFIYSCKGFTMVGSMSRHIEAEGFN